MYYGGRSITLYIILLYFIYSQTFVSRRTDRAAPWARRPRSMAREDGSGRRRRLWSTRCRRRHRVHYRRRRPTVHYATTAGGGPVAVRYSYYQSFAAVAVATMRCFRDTFRRRRRLLRPGRRFESLLCPWTVYLQKKNERCILLIKTRIYKKKKNMRD